MSHSITLNQESFFTKKKKKNNHPKAGLYFLISKFEDV